jgi:hypothetical protein
LISRLRKKDAQLEAFKEAGITQQLMVDNPTLAATL